MELVEYKLDRNAQHHRITPHWIEDGGYFPDPDDHTMVGLVESPPRRHKVPETVTRLDAAGLHARVAGLHARFPMMTGALPDDQTTMTSEEVTAMASAWLAEKGV